MSATFDEVFDWLMIRQRVTELSIALWSWRVQGATGPALRDLERDYCKALDLLWEAQERVRRAA